MESEASTFMPPVLPVLAAAVSAFVLGGLWYSPVLFGRAWQRLTGLTDEQLKAANPVRIFVPAFVLAAVAAWVFSMFLGPRPGLGMGLSAGASAGLCWVAASMGINDLFERRPLMLWLINAGYHTVAFTLFGAIYGLWQ
jgi:hypothetical protein